MGQDFTDLFDRSERWTMANARCTGDCRSRSIHQILLCSKSLSVEVQSSRLSSASQKQAEKVSNTKTKIVSLEPQNIFRSSESLGMCEPEMGTVFQLLDRVVNVRPGTGVPIGTRGTVVGIMHGATPLDAYYEILFDHLPETSLEAILLGKNQQACRTKVRSYHLLNYSHSLRLRSMNENYTQQKSTPHMNARQQPAVDTASSHMAPRASNQNYPGAQPKSAPAGPVRRNPMSTQVQRPPETASNQPNSSYIVFHSTSQYPGMINSPPVSQHPFQQQYSFNPSPPQLMNQHYSTIDPNYRPSPLPPSFSPMNVTSPGIRPNSPQNANFHPFVSNSSTDHSPPAQTPPSTPSRTLNPLAVEFSPASQESSPQPQNWMLSEQHRKPKPLIDVRYFVIRWILVLFLS